MMKSILELEVLSIIRSRSIHTKYKHFIDSSFFRTSETRLIYKTIMSYHKEIKGTFLNLKSLWMMLEKQIEEDEYPLYRSLLKKMKYDKDTDIEVIEHTITRFAQESLLRETLDKTITQLGDPQDLRLEDLKKEIQRIIAIRAKAKAIDYDYMSQDDERITLTGEPTRLPTGLSGELDTHLKGGLGTGELGFILAPPGRGKTLTLVNLGATALRRGSRVLHLTLEINARKVAQRYDCCLTDSTMEEIRERPSMLKERLKEISKSSGHAKPLVIKDFSYSHCSMGDLHHILETYKEEGDVFDLLIIDYADLMVPPQQYKDTRHEVTKIYEELRIIAGAYKIPVWTASQSNRGSLSKRLVKMEDIAEAFTKAAIADLIIGLCQTEDEKDEKVMRLFVAKSRMSSTNPIVTVIADPDRMIVKGYKDNSDNGVSDRIHNQAKKRGI